MFSVFLCMIIIVLVCRECLLLFVGGATHSFLLGIGQCVGAHNYKVSPHLSLLTNSGLSHDFGAYKIFQFFINFLQWSTIWTIWILATVAALIGINTSNPSFDINPQMIAILVLYEYISHFYLYTFPAHVRWKHFLFF